ncbi:hypothetical protein GJAV_G00218700 [Gymnothorax javanicus]|nr:hypothetical protein GJAV_G00218700 [Gymnothorax javanicus]
MQVKMTAHPWLSKVTFSCGFIVGFCLTFFIIGYIRGIPRGQWFHRLATLCNAPAGDFDAVPPISSSSYNPKLSEGLRCWVLANRSVSYSKSFPCCTGIMLLVDSTHDPNGPGALTAVEKLEKLRYEANVVFTSFRRRYNRFHGAANDAKVVFEKLRPTLYQSLEHPLMIFGWGLGTCGGRDYKLSRHMALQLEDALWNDSSLELVKVGCCPQTERPL